MRERRVNERKEEQMREKERQTNRKAGWKRGEEKKKKLSLSWLSGVGEWWRV